jgi:hypothetical protein
MAVTPVHLLVFRDGRTQASGSRLKAALASRLQELSFNRCKDAILSALLAAGELECAAADAQLGFAEPDLSSLKALGKVTDAVAGLMLVSGSLDSAELISVLESAGVPEVLSVSTPEGFAYYALHPLSYADVLDCLPLRDAVAVIGIRSIGTTLSAVTAAAARSRGKQAARITVRPTGHPYNRELDFSDREQAFTRDWLRRGAEFLVVDEGPGLSGSSFLSVAEALEREGVSPEQITLICAHQPEFGHFRANHGAQRARRFRWVAVRGESRKPADADKFIGAGEWRREQFCSEQDWPAVWTTFERLKYLSAEGTSAGNEGQRFYKFAGLGHYGETVIEREKLVAEAGFGPEPRQEGHGFCSYPWLTGRPMTADDLSPAVIDRLARYCSFRAGVLSVPEANIAQLQQMAEHNLSEFKLDIPVQLRLKRPVMADSRMQPHEWVLAPNGQMLKTDSGSHGDDHFFPGPTDIAWDLAGAILEWQMGEAQKSAFLDSYCRASGDDAQKRIRDYVVAYAAFRAGYCLMAANAMQGSSEQARLDTAATRYRSILQANAELAIAA